MSTLIQGNLEEVRERLITVISTFIPGLVIGSPGLGKSAIVKSIAEEFNLKVIDVRLSQCDPTDLLGFPIVDKVSKIAEYAPMSTFPLEDTPVPEGYDGWLVFLDEFNSADRGTSKAAYKLLHDRMVGQKKLHPKVAMVGAGNHDTDGALTEELATPLKSRVIHMHVLSDHKVWSKWALEADIDHRIRSFIRSRPSELNTFNPDKLEQDVTFACERTWEFAHKILQAAERTNSEQHLLPLLAGTVGEASARQFISFTANYNDIASYDDIVRDPHNAKLPTSASGRYAACGILSEFCEEESIKAAMIYLERLPKEFQVIALRDIYAKNSTVLDLAPVQAWIANNNTVLF